MTDDLVFRKSIPLPRDMGTIDVRGLSLDDISVLLTANLPIVIRAVEQFNASNNALYSRASMDEFMLTVATQFPVLAAHVIACAADEPAEVDRYRKLPAGASIVCLLAVAELTLEDMSAIADPSPALASLLRRALAGASPMPPTPSPAITGA